MIVKDWLESGKPKNEPFIIRRDFRIPQDVSYFKTMARSIIESAIFYCNNNFKIEPLDLMFFNDMAYKYEFEGFPFTAVYSNGTISIGAKITAL